MKLHRLLSLLAVLTAATALPAARAAEPTRPNFRAEFFKLCDLATDYLGENVLFTPEEMHREHYKDSYVVRALAVAYDVTGDTKYLKACQAWSDKMISCQDGMIPKGAYTMNYGRKPGETQGDWYVADSSSIGMALLATAKRTSDPALHAKYVQSVRKFADLVIGNYIRDGGMTDGLWPKYDGPWWCSTGIFGSMGFLLYDECGEKKYLDAALGAVDWLNRHQFGGVNPYPLSEQGPALILYYNEAYSAGYPHIQANTERYAAMMTHLHDAVKWMDAHQRGHTGGKGSDSHSQWGSKSGAMPFCLYVWSRYVPESVELTRKADAELAYVCSVLNDPKRLARDKNRLTQLMDFTMMSLAEKVAPGSMYRR